MEKAVTTWEDLHHTSKSKVALCIAGFVLGIALLAIISGNLFGFADSIADSSISAAQVRLYGGILFAVFSAAMLFGAFSFRKKTPIESLKKYAKKTSDPVSTMAALQNTWENGVQLAPKRRLDDAFLIDFLNGYYATVVTMDDVVWAYKSVTKLDGVVKTNTGINLHHADGKGDFLSMSEKSVDYILQYLMERRNDVALGKTKALEAMMDQKDLPGLREYALQQRTSTVV